MSSKSTYLEQDLVNIIASMTFRLPNYPSVFFEAGYKVEYIEKEFDSSYDGKEVKFDIVLNNITKNHSLAFECKSGSAEPDQLLKYSRLTSEELVRVGGVSSDLPSSHTHDIAVVFNDCNTEKILADTSIHDFTNICISHSPTEIAMLELPFKDDDLSALFATPIEYPDFLHEVFRVGGQTPPFKYVKLLASELIALSVNGKESFHLSDLAPGVCSSIPELYPERIGEQMRRDIESKISSVLTEGTKFELQEYIHWDKATASGKLKKIKPGCKAISYQAFKTQANEMSERLRLKSQIPQKYLTKPKQPKHDPNQYEIKFDFDFEETRHS